MSLDVSLIMPGCPHCGRRDEEVYSANITHNLQQMADRVGIYNALWDPEKDGYKYAKDIIYILLVGINRLKLNPEKYKQYDSPNGWGKYEHFVPFVEDYLEACQLWPNALIEVSV